MSNQIDTLFLEASRQQLRFSTSGGLLTVEDLWSLSLQALDAIALSVDARLRQSAATFLATASTKKTAARAQDELALEILKVVIDIKQGEIEAAKAAKAKRDRRAFLQDLLAKAEAKKLESLSAEDIQKQLAELEG